MGLSRAVDNNAAALCVASDELGRGPFSAPHRRLSESVTATSARNNLRETSFSPLDNHLSWMSPYPPPLFPSRYSPYSLS
jgi:hypothetical protein